MCKPLLQGHAKLDVWSEVVQPFNLMPRFALEGTSNAVMGALVGGLLPRFMDRSAAIWCTCLADLSHAGHQLLAAVVSTYNRLEQVSKAFDDPTLCLPADLGTTTSAGQLIQHTDKQEELLPRHSHFQPNSPSQIHACTLAG